MSCSEALPTLLSTLLITAVANTPRAGHYLLIVVALLPLLSRLVARYTITARLLVLDASIDAANLALIRAQSSSSVLQQVTVLTQRRRLRSLQRRASELRCSGSPSPSLLRPFWGPGAVATWRDIRRCIVGVRDVERSLQHAVEFELQSLLADEVLSVERQLALMHGATPLPPLAIAGSV
ncbi:hypothetical protein MKEN_01171100 [Mycena kentingensis (nom. inval.)]|nr:hypothetical protein MKEN_01171100 [Mycena kentingensis (nom. inval.)]